MCSSGIGFDPRHDGQRLRFGFHGIWQGTAVLYDTDSMSLWLHINGECIDGPKKGVELRPIIGRHVQWREWRQEHPDTEVMAPIAKHAAEYFPEPAAARGLDDFPGPFSPTIQTRDDRLGLSDLVYGVKVGDHTRAYPFARLRYDDDGVVNDELDGVPIVIVYDRKTGSCTGYERRVDGKTLVFRRQNGLVAAGSTFDRDGRCIRGPLKGKELPMLFGLQAEWYGWFAVYPGTDVWLE